MPDQSALDFMREARGRLPRLPPFIIVTSKGSEAAAIAALNLGAAHYITKREGYRKQLPHAIENAIAYDQINRLNGQLSQSWPSARRQRRRCR